MIQLHDTARCGACQQENTIIFEKVCLGKGWQRSGVSPKYSLYTSVVFFVYSSINGSSALLVHDSPFSRMCISIVKLPLPYWICKYNKKNRLKSRLWLDYFLPINKRPALVAGLFDREKLSPWWFLNMLGIELKRWYTIYPSRYLKNWT